MIRGVFFDLDGTLYDRDAAMLRLAHDQYAAFRDHLRPRVDEQTFTGRFLELDDHGYTSRSDVYRRIAEAFGLNNWLTVDLERHFWEAYNRRCELSADTWATLHTLRRAGLCLGIVTNGQTEWQSRKIEGLGLGSFFDVVLISEQEGIRKPDTRIFDRARERCGIGRPSDAMFVGDHPEVDVAGAHGAGMVAVWKRVPYWTLTTQGAITIDRLTEILSIVALGTPGNP
jgi:putative hydrolase of the HAD superfamily